MRTLVENGPRVVGGQFGRQNYRINRTVNHSVSRCKASSKVGSDPLEPQVSHDEATEGEGKAAGDHVSSLLCIYMDTHVGTYMHFL